MKIEILGMGCAKCTQLAMNVAAAVKELSISADVVKVTDIETITEYGVMMTPAVAVDGKVVSAGKVLTVAEVKKMFGGRTNEKGFSCDCGGCCGN